MGGSVLFSVIIPSYNRGDVIGIAIDSVIRQTFTNWELIIIDDGSDDITGEIIKSYLCDERIEYLKTSNAGVSAARNTGATHAIGDYLFFLDSDDHITDTFFAEYYSAVNCDAKPDVVVSGYVRKDIATDSQRIFLPRPGGPLINYLWQPYLAGCFCIRRRIFEAINGYDTTLKYAENSELFIRLGQYGRSNPLIVVPISKAMTLINVNTATRTKKHVQNRFSSTKYILYKHRSLFDLLRKEKATLLDVLAVCAFELQAHKEALDFCYQSLRLKFSLLKLLRYIFFKTRLINRL